MLREREVLGKLGIGRTTLYELRRSGRLPEVKIGKAVRYRTEDVENVAREGWAR